MAAFGQLQSSRRRVFWPLLHWPQRMRFPVTCAPRAMAPGRGHGSESGSGPNGRSIVVLGGNGEPGGPVGLGQLAGAGRACAVAAGADRARGAGCINPGLSGSPASSASLGTACRLPCCRARLHHATGGTGTATHHCGYEGRPGTGDRHHRDSTRHGSGRSHEGISAGAGQNPTRVRVGESVWPVQITARIRGLPPSPGAQQPST